MPSPCGPQVGFPVVLPTPPENNHTSSKGGGGRGVRPLHAPRQIDSPSSSKRVSVPPPSISKDRPSAYKAGQYFAHLSPFLLRLFRPSSRISSCEPPYMLSHLIFYPSLSWAASFPIPFALGSLSELYVRTPISKYMEACESWVIILPKSQELSPRWSLFERILFSGVQGLVLYGLLHTLSTSPILLCLPKVGGESYALFLRRPDIKVAPWIHINPTVDRCATSPSSLIYLFLLPLVSYRRHRLATLIRPRFPISTCNTERHLPTMFA